VRADLGGTCKIRLPEELCVGVAEGGTEIIPSGDVTDHFEFETEPGKTYVLGIA
jgi:hypothetical protein